MESVFLYRAGSGSLYKWNQFFLYRVGSGYGLGLVIRESEFSSRVKCGAVLSVEFLENNLEITSRFCKSLGFSKSEISHFS